VIEAREHVDPVFYSNLLDIELPIEAQNQFVKLANAVGIPLKRTWQPLNRHPHFQRRNMPNLIAPWDFFNKKYIEPEQCHLPVSDEFQRTRLFELDCHPLVSEETVAAAASRLKSIMG
jgi:hypothetical protein